MLRLASRGSRRWTLAVAEIAVWATLALAGLLALTMVSGPRRVATIIPLIVTALIAAVVFPILARESDESRLYEWLPAGGFAGLLSWCYVALEPYAPAAPIVLLGAGIVGGLVGGRAPAALAAAIAGAVYLAVRPISMSSVAVAGSLFGTAFLTGYLVRELRAHYRAELEEHRLATAVRTRLVAVLDAVDEAIVFSDRLGAVRLVNARAAELLDVIPDEFVGRPRVDLLRSVARKTDDPEEFMELFQPLHDEPELEVRSQIDQIIPARRRLRLYSGPARDDSGARVGRIDVYTDVTENERRAAENARLYEEARKTAESYLRGLLPEGLPKLPRMSLVAHYIPVAGERAVCGDFYDFITLSDGRLAVVIGDVCGSGPASARDAALTRYTLRSFAAEAENPAALVERAALHVESQLPPDRFVRLLYAVLDPERAQIEYTNAGHVPPLVHRARTGETAWLEEGGLPLGVEAEAQYKAGRISLEPGDLAVFYTDGVTEARRAGRPFGTGRLVDLVRDWGAGSPGELVQAIVRAVEAWGPESERHDDIALVVTQVVPDALVGEPVRELVLPNEPSRQAEIRAFVGGFLADIRAPVEDSTEILLAVGEAAANACRHGRRQEGRSEVRIKCELHGRDVIVTVADDGPGFDPDAYEGGLPERFASGGRGLYLMRTLTDRVDFLSSSSGTTVRLLKRLGTGVE